MSHYYVTSAAHNDGNPPEAFFCPLTLDVMKNPVINTKTGMVFEKRAIMKWLRGGHGTCPLTRQPLSVSDLVDDMGLQYEISLWQELAIRDQMKLSMKDVPMSSHNSTTYAASLNANQQRRPKVSVAPACQQEIETGGKQPTNFWAQTGPIPFTMPLPKYFSMPSRLVGAVLVSMSARN